MIFVSWSKWKLLYYSLKRILKKPETKIVILYLIKRLVRYNFIYINIKDKKLNIFLINLIKLININMILLFYKLFIY